MMLQIHALTTDAQITSAFPLMSHLRPNLKAESFVATVRLQEGDGYRLYGGYSGDTVVVLAGVRDAHTLSRGPHLFVDDLVTLASEQGKGHGTAMLRYLAADARRRNFPRLYLDSRDTALTFYTKLGFQPLPSVPCWIATDQLP